MFSCLRLFWNMAFGFALIVAGTAIGPWFGARTQGQEPVAKPEESRERKLDEVLKRLDDLRKQVEELRREGGKSVTSPAKTVAATGDGSLPAEWVKALKWRPIGPAGMGGRITDMSVLETDPSTYWIATASGGLLKTVNNGVTFEHQFDHEATVSLGAVCVAPSNKEIVWVGTGENNPRNSVSYGDGVYKSMDGGKKWTNMGLKNTYQIGRIIVHPTNPDIVYVGALGRLYGPNEDRGVYKTFDGGKTWERILFVDDKTGVIEMSMHPTDPETLIVAMWERQRDEFDSHRGEPAVVDGYDAYDPIKKWGPGSGLHKTIDGGKSWKKLTAGLPTGNLGRMDIEYYRKDPNIVYAIIDCEKIGMGTPPSRVYLGVLGEDGGGGAKLTQITPRSPAAKAKLKAGDVIKSIDNMPLTKYSEITAALRGHRAGDKLVLQVVRDDKTIEITVTLEDRPLGAGGAAPSQAYLGIQGEDAADGAKLTQITDGGPAAKASLKVGDIVKSVDKDPIVSYEQFTEILRTHMPGDKLLLEVSRDEKLIEITVTPEERPLSQFGGGGGGGSPGGRGGRGGPGGELAQLFGALAEDTEGGIKITRVIEERAADKAQVEEGDIVTEIDGVKITGVQQVVDLLRDKKDGDKVVLKITRGEGDKKESKDLTVTLESPGGGSRTRPWTFMYAGQQPNVQEQQGLDSHEYGGIYKSTDGGESWTRINSLNPRPMYFSQIRVDPSDDKFIYVLGVQLHRSRDGGKIFTADGGRGVHADQHTLWIDPRDGRHMIVGCDGGFYATYDRMANWEHLNHVAIGQFYHVAVDNRQPYRVYGGLQDNGSWGGPSRTLNGGGPINEDWISVGSGDGFVCRVDPFDPDLVYFESQNGTMGRRNLRTGERATIRPRPQRGQRYRFNWNSPFILSNHNPGIFYAAGNYVFRSVKRGDDLRAISPEIARTGRGTATALAESPRNSDVLWAGTDDGNLWVTRDGGANWKNVADKLGLPGPRWVATVEPSRFVEGRCYVACDAHRSNDDEPYLLATEDFGETWKSLRANLPAGSTRCLREDIKNPNLLFCGTEFACWATLDRGAKWTKLNNNLPTVAIHELAIHPTAGEMVAATHGRSLWVLDVTPLRQMSVDIVKSPVHLYEPNTVVRWRAEPARSSSGGVQRFVGENPIRSAQLYYSLAAKPEKVSLKIIDVTGATVRELEPKLEAGLQVATWDLARISPRASGGAAAGAGGSQARSRGPGGRRPGGDPQPGGEAQPPAETPPGAPAAQPPTPTTTPSPTTTQAGAGGGQRQGGGGGGFGGGPSSVPAGVYRVVLTVDDQEFSQTIKIEADPTLPTGVVANEEFEEEEALKKQEKDRTRNVRPMFIDD